MRWVARGLLGLLVCGVLAWAAQAVWSVWLAERQSQAVLAQVESGVVDFARVGPADWERVYFFHPYTPAERVRQMLGSIGATLTEPALNPMTPSTWWCSSAASA